MTKKHVKGQDRSKSTDVDTSDSKKAESRPKNDVKENIEENNVADNDLNPFMEDQPTYGYMEDPEKGMKEDKTARKQ